MRSTPQHRDAVVTALFDGRRTPVLRATRPALRWRLLHAGVTLALLTAAVLAGVSMGLGGPAVSPVATTSVAP